jgi:selenium metabolism protein YedF
MDKETLDCRGLACPAPVVETKKKLGQMTAGTLTVLVDNETAKNNLLKLAGSLDLDSAAKEDEGLFAVTVIKDGDISVKNAKERKVILVTAETFGRGSEELGMLLMKSFFYALCESDTPPEHIYLVNGGVKLACVGSAVLESLEGLQAQGVAIHSCGLCLDFFELKDKLKVGDVTNMYAIVDELTGADTVIL